MAKKVPVAKKKDDSTGLLIGGGVVLGMGVGFLIGNIPAGLFIGLGLGLIGAFVFRNK